MMRDEFYSFEMCIVAGWVELRGPNLHALRPLLDAISQENNR